MDDQSQDPWKPSRDPLPPIDLGSLPTPLSEFEADRRQARNHRVLTGAAMAALIAAAAVVIAVSGSGGNDLSTGGHNPRDGGDISASGARVLRGLPSSPIDGRQSWRLPVVVKPQTQVHDGDVVMIYGKGFEPNQSLGIVQCSSEADTLNAGVAACDLTSPGGQQFDDVSYANARADGTVAAPYKVRRFIDTPDGGRIDCQSAAERCLVGIGAISNYDQSGGAYIDLDGAPPFATPAFGLAAPGPFASGHVVQALATKLVPGRQYRIEQCHDERCHTLFDGRPDLAGTLGAAVTVTRSFTDSADGSTVECGNGCTVRVNGIGVKGGSSAPFPDPVPIAFTDQTITTAAPPPPTTTVAPPPPPPSTPAVPSPPVEGPSTTATTQPGSSPPVTSSAPPVTDTTIPPPVTDLPPDGPGPPVTPGATTAPG